MVISQNPVKFIFHSYSESSTFGRPGHGRSIPDQMAISRIPALTAHISWQLIFHSYSESSPFGRPGLGRSTPIWVAISLIPTLTTFISFLLWELNILADQVLAYLPPPIQCWFHRFLFWQLTTLRAQHLADQFLADVTPHIRWQFHRFLLYPENSYLADQVFGRSTPPSYGNFTDCCSDSSYFTPTLRAQYLADKVFADLPPCQMAILQIPVKFIFHSYSESSTFGRLGHGRSIPNQMAISQIPALTAHISWQLIFHSYSESSTFGRPGLGRSTPIWVVISLIPTLTTFISFLLWELNIWQTRSWHIYPPIQWWFHRFLFWQLTTLRAQHLADQFLADVTPHIRWQIHRFLLYSESSYMADWVLADQHPPSYGNFTDCCSDSSYFIPILTAPHLGRPGLGRSTPPHQWQFHRFLLYPESSYLADQVLADLPPVKWQFCRFLLWQLIFHSYSDSSTFGRTVLGRCNPPHQMAISQIPALPWELIFGRPSVGRSTPESNGNFTDCCSDSSYFIPTLRAQYLADKVFADLPPCLMAILQIPVKFLFHSFSKSSSFGRPCPDRSSPIQWWFYRFLFLQLNTLRAYHLADQVLTDLPPPIKWQFHRLLWNSYFIPTLRAHIWQTKWWQIYPLSNGNFTDCCSDSSYFIPTLRAHHLADQVLTDLPPHQMAISQIPALTAHYFKSSTFDRPGLGRSTPHIRWQFHRFLWNLYFIPTLRAQHLADQVLADLPTPIKWQFHRFLLYSESSYLSDQVLADQPPTHQW